MPIDRISFIMWSTLTNGTTLSFVWLKVGTPMIRFLLSRDQMVGRGDCASALDNFADDRATLAIIAGSPSRDIHDLLSPPGDRRRLGRRHLCPHRPRLCPRLQGVCHDELRPWRMGRLRRGAGWHW